MLIVDDDIQISKTLNMALTSWDYTCSETGTITGAAELLKSEDPQVVVLDIELPDGSGLDFLNEIKREHPETIVIMITGHVDVENTVASLRGGAHDFIGKPIHLEELRVTLRNSVETRKLRKEVRRIRRSRARKFSFDQIIGESPAIKKTIETARKVAVSDIGSILLQGETGTGKELFAKAVHFASERAEAPFMAINCAAIPDTLIESELFGYEQGAFTDAKKRKEGLFEQADGGTLLLDEIGELDISLQAKLLRVLEEGRFRRIGGLKEIPLDVRVIASTNKNLKEECLQDKFRLDLYYRLSVVMIDIPPLRERSDDVIVLAHHYIESINRKRGGEKKLTGISKDVEKLFRSYEWTGNVRELRNVIERASILEDGEIVTTEHLPVDLVGGANTAQATGAFVLPEEGVPLSVVELALVRQAVERTNGNLTRAAKLLGISRDQLRYRLKKGQDESEKAVFGVAE